MSRVLAVGPALPEHRYAQSEITSTIGPLITAPGPRRVLLERLHAASGVTTRHLALPLVELAEPSSFGRSNAHFLREGADLAEQACRRALDAAGLAATDVDLVFFTTVTGISAPSLDALLVPRLGLRHDVRRVPSFGLGCVAGAAGLARVHDHLVGHPDGVALLVSVELCSLTFQPDDGSTANLVSSGLFGDGATAVVVVGDEFDESRQTPPGTMSRTAPVDVVDSRSRLYPETADLLGWDVRDTGFGIVLSAGLPEIVGLHLAGDVKELLGAHGLTTDDVDAWVVHAGGPRIVDAVRDALGLDEHAVRRTRAVLAATGNLSSSSVLHVLAATLADDDPPPGGVAVLMAFGPGVSTELVLLRRPPLDGGAAC